MATTIGNKSAPTRQKEPPAPPKETPAPTKKTQIPSKATEVTKWLEVIEAKAFVDKFYNQGYYKVDSVDDDAINSIVKPTQPGLANALKNSLAERKKRKEEAGKTIPPPKLPAGFTFDLSAPKLESPDGIEFSVTKSLSVESTNAAIVSPNNIKPEEWIVIARSANLLYAYDMDADEPKWAKTPVLDWVVPARDDFARSEILHGKVTSTLAYSEETASFVTSGFDTQTATAGYAFCAASFERNHKEKTARSSEIKTLILVGMWKYPRVKIYLEKCTKPSERFKKAILTALSAQDSFGELNKVFKEFGHVIPSGVLLGGQLCYKKSSKDIKSKDESSEETSIKTAVEAKMGAASASLGAAFGSGTGTQTGNVNLNEFTSFTNQGGDSLLCSNPPAWAPTVKDPAYWAVIEMEEMRPTIDLLDPELKQQVIDVWNSSQAISNPKELAWKNEEGKLFTDITIDNGGFVAAMRQCSVPTRGSVQLISSGSKGDPATGATYTHGAIDADRWIECNSICMPVSQGGSFRTMFNSSFEPPPDGRLIFVPSTLRFGQWQSLSDKAEAWLEPKIKDEDGFLFVNIKAEPGQRGGVQGWLNKQLFAGSFAQNYHTGPQDDEWIEQQNFCIPVPEGTIFNITFDPKLLNPTVHAYWMPLNDTHWKMQSAVPVPIKTEILAGTDGILHGWIKQTRDGDRGTLKLYTGNDAVKANPEKLPCAAASMHYYDAHRCWVLYSSVMLPVAKGTPYKVVHTTTSGSPEAQVFWTPIVPR